uniref:Uncharacterized protein n=1 Tax=Oryza nivara TaxID=4536 RepID=A0A0E0ILG6_ORYNI
MQCRHRLVEDEVELKLCIRRCLVELEFHRQARFMEKMESWSSWRRQERWTFELVLVGGRRGREGWGCS